MDRIWVAVRFQHQGPDYDDKELEAMPQYQVVAVDKAKDSRNLSGDFDLQVRYLVKQNHIIIAQRQGRLAYDPWETSSCFEGRDWSVPM